MLVNAARQHVLGPLVFLGMLLGLSPVNAGPGGADEAFWRAAWLLPRQPDTMVIVERDEGTHVRNGKPHVEAFVTHGDRVVYPIRQRVDGTRGMEYLALLNKRRALAARTAGEGQRSSSSSVAIRPGAQGQTLTMPSPEDLLASDPAAFEELLETARPAPVSAEVKARILSSLPREGVVSHLDASAREKLASLSDMLRLTQRHSVYEVVVIGVPQAFVGLHARAVVLISNAALRLLQPDELQALVAHEIGHEYFWLDYKRLSRVRNDRRLNDLELLCDAIAIVTLHRLGIGPSRLIAGLDKVSRFNREQFGIADNEQAFPTLAERRQFAQVVGAWTAHEPHRP